MAEGVIINGDVIDNYLFRPIISGGSILNGTVVVTSVNNLDTSGGVIEGGSFPQTIVWNVIVSGGTLLNGSSSISIIYPISVSGGVGLSGIDLVGRLFNKNSSGGTIVNGTAGISTIYNVIKLGSILVGGVGLVSSGDVYVEYATGGILATGNADVYINPAGHGGAIIGGDGVDIKFTIPVLSGVVDIGGNAPLIFYQTIPVGGNCLIGGKGLLLFVKPDIIVSGGIRISGETIVTRGVERARRANECIIKKAYRCDKGCKVAVKFKKGVVAGVTVCDDSAKIAELSSYARNMN